MSVNAPPDSEHPDSEHLDTETLSDLSAGLLDRSAASLATAHLELCAACRREAAALDGIAAMLASAADVGPMPTDVADRLDAALRAAVSPVDLPEGVTPLPTAATRRWWADHRVLQAAAAVVLVVAGGAIAVPVLQNSGSSDSGAANTADYAGAPEAGAAAPQADSGGQGTRTSAKAKTVLATGTNYTDESLARDISNLLSSEQSEHAPQAAAGDKVTATGQGSARLADPRALADCVDELAPGRVAQPLLVDVARYQGREATVIVLDEPTAADRVQIWVVESGCGNGNARTMHFESAERP